MNPVRRGAAWIYRILITLFAAAVVVEIFFAGLAIFGAMPGEDESVTHETIEDKFEAHAGLGWVLAIAALLLLTVILVAWTGPRSIGATFALAVLTVVQMILGGAGEDAPVAGAFHAINAFLVLGLSFFLAFRAWRGQLLIPPSRLGGTAPSLPSAPETSAGSAI